MLSCRREKGGTVMDLAMPAAAAAALDALERRGYESYVVGGCVRDALLGREPHDWDICTAAPPEAVEAVFAGSRVLETGRKHGTVTLLTEDGPLEITTFRREGTYSDARRPDTVEFIDDIHEDLLRRDFTVNAMAWSPRRGLRDDFGGREDLAAGLIRCVGAPAERFGEDALRILRALRFAARYGFAVEEDTAASLRALRETLCRVSPERIFSELKGILCAPGAGDMLRTFPEVFFVFLPELAPCLGFDQRMPEHHQYDVWHHIACTVDAIEADPVLRLTMLFHDAGKPASFTWDPETGRAHFYGHPARGAAMADAALRRLRSDNALREAVVALVYDHDFRSGGNRRAVRRLLARLGEENARRLVSVILADAAGHTPATGARMTARAEELRALTDEILAEGRCLTVGDLAVGGGDLLALGMAPGPGVGRVLRTLLEEVWDEKLPNGREALLRRAEELKEETP